jgi:hypothetical protein
MKAILGMLALLAVASTASATFAPWYYQTLYKNKCYVPGCDQVRNGRVMAQAAISQFVDLATRRHTSHRHATAWVRQSHSRLQLLC